MNIPGFASMLKRASAGTLLAATLTGGGFALADEAWDAFPTTTASEVAYPASAAGSGAYGLGELGALAFARRRRRLQRAETAKMKKQVNAMRTVGSQLETRLRRAGLDREAESLGELIELKAADTSASGQAKLSDAIGRTRLLLDQAAHAASQGETLPWPPREAFLKSLENTHQALTPTG